MYTKLLAVSSKFLPIMYALIGFGMLIIVHEFGHFIFCKIFGVHTPTFSIGMGPKLIERKIGTTNFRLSALPLGGYVEIAGNQEVGQGEQAHSQETGENSFKSKAYWKKFLIMMGGILFNLGFSYIALSAIFALGAPKLAITIQNTLKDSAAEHAGLERNDTIIELNNYSVGDNPEKLADSLASLKQAAGKHIPITIIRNGETRSFSIHLPTNDGSTAPSLGIELGFKPSGSIERLPIKESITRGISTTNSYIKQTIIGLATMINRKSLKGAGGPVMIISESVRQAQAGMMFLIIFLAIISINLAVMNLLPLPILDGGQLLFVTIESIIGHELPSPIKNGIFIGSWALILLLILFLSYNDILMLFKSLR